jgi:hypothetical protein
MEHDHLEPEVLERLLVLDRTEDQNRSSPVLPSSSPTR